MLSFLWNQCTSPTGLDNHFFDAIAPIQLQAGWAHWGFFSFGDPDVQ